MPHTLVVHRWSRRLVAIAVVTAVSSTPVESVVSAADTTRLVDATGTIALRVPSDWRDSDVSPGMSDEGQPRGRIVATPDQFELQTTGHVPLVWATVVPAPADPDVWLENSTVYSRCVRGGSETFDNGNVLGTLVSWTDCSNRKSLLVQVAGRSKRNRQAAIAVQVVLPRADDALVDQIVDSLEIMPESVETEAAPVDIDSVVLIGRPVDAFIIDELPADVTRVVDDTHALAVSVPTRFTDTHTLNEFNDDGSPRPVVIAAPNLTDFLRDGDSGVLAIRLPYVDPATLLTNADYSFCSDSGFRTISNGSYKGLVRMWVQCGGPHDRIAAIALVPPDESATLLLEVALPDDELAALQIAIASVELLEPRLGTVPAH
jgi:hypothetical protein